MFVVQQEHPTHDLCLNDQRNLRGPRSLFWRHLWRSTYRLGRADPYSATRSTVRPSICRATEAEALSSSTRRWISLIFPLRGPQRRLRREFTRQRLLVSFYLRRGCRRRSGPGADHDQPSSGPSLSTTNLIPATFDHALVQGVPHVEVILISTQPIFTTSCMLRAPLAAPALA
jgi:hypothetical protein